jgi:segregation and condensation protein A
MTAIDNDASVQEEMQGSDYRIRLENYYGPLDLLLYLIKQHEVDILSIPIADITKQYVQYVEEIRKLNIDIASEFVVMAATLMRIKSREIRPDPGEQIDDEEIEDPREELVQNLLRYRTFKSRARKLREREDQFSRHFSRPDVRDRFREKLEQEPRLEEMDVSLWPLVRAYAEIQEETLLEAPSTIVYDDIPQDEIMDRILKRLEESDQTSFDELIGPHPTPYQAVSYFLGMLELAKRRQLHLVQDQNDGDISIAPGTEFGK